MKLYFLGFLFLLSSCGSDFLYDNHLVNKAKVNDSIVSSKILENLPLPEKKLPVVVYDFQDQTGQFKSNDNFSEYSSAVTKGGISVLIKSLLDSGNGSWFLVAERGGLNDLLKERQIIRSMREEYLGKDGKKLSPLPPLIYGGLLLEGGIVFYDSNIITGGAAAGYFGISGSTQYRRDIVTVYLRAVDISSGQIVLAVNSSKTVFSYGVNAGLVRYLSFDKLLETEFGFTINEPNQLAVRQAIDTSVYSLIMEGALKGIWNFSDKEKGDQAIKEYLERRDGDRKDDLFKKFFGNSDAEKVVEKPQKQQINK